MIEFQSISKSFIKNSREVVALHDVSLTINQGDIFGVIGYSGAGKSTLVRLVNALEKPTSGQVIIDRQSLDQLSPLALRQMKKRIGMIFQHFNLLETKTVAENIALPLKLNGKLSKKEMDARVDELLAYVEIPDKKHAYPRELSGGQKQRVGIARALANNPDILLCDEATSALDPQTTQSILKLLRKINQEQGITIMMVTHQMEVVASICDRIAVMDQGQVVETGSTKDVFRDPKEAMTRKFINTLIEEEIPTSIINNLDRTLPNHIYRLEFLGESAIKPVVNELILTQLVVVNILFSNMIEIEGSVIGSMFVQLVGSESSIQEAVQFLQARGVRITQNQIEAA